jgi:catechol 2,3-dioxygenase-like lactoylglutathione lyase family enzyme
MKVTGFNHVTIRVTDLERSLTFYRDVLGMRLVHHGRKDVYLEWGTAWVCLIERDGKAEEGSQGPGVDHIAFSIAEEDFDDAVAVLQKAKVPVVRGPVERGLGC